MKKRILTFVLSLVMILSCVTVSALAVEADNTWYGDGSATEYRIYDAADLLAFAAALKAGTTFDGKTVYLCNDIVLNEGNAADWATNAPATVYDALNTKTFFGGTFDGQGYVISGLYSTTGSTGLIPRVYNGATIKNVTIMNSYFEGASYASAVVSLYTATVNGSILTIENVHLENTNVIGGDRVAGVLTYIWDVSATEVKVNMNNITFVGGKITGTRHSGGIIGAIYNASSYDHGVELTMDKIVVNSALTFTNTKTDGSTVRSGGVIGYVSGFRRIDMTNIMVDGSLTIVGTKTGSTPFVGEVRSPKDYTSTTVDDVTIYSELNISNALATPQMTNVEAFLSSRTNAELYPKITMKQIYSNTDNAGTTSSRKTNQGGNDFYPEGSDHKRTTAQLQGQQLFDGWMITGANSYPVPTVRPVRLIGYQSSYATDVKDANKDDETYSIRLIAALNDAFYTEAGFEGISISYVKKGETEPTVVPKDAYTCKYAYKSVKGVNKAGEEEIYEATKYYADAFIALEITEIPEDVTTFTITLNAFAGKDDVTFDGITRTVQISAQ